MAADVAVGTDDRDALEARPGAGRRRPGLVLGRRGRRPRGRLAAPPGDDPRPCRRPASGALVDRRRVQPRGRGDRALGGRPTRRRGARLGGRGRRDPGRTPGPSSTRRSGRAAAAPGRARRGRGIRVGIFLPMLPETAIAVLALGRLRAVFTPIFSGYAAPAVAARLRRVRGDPPHHRRRLLPARARSSRSRRSPTRRSRAAPSVRTVVVVRRLGRTALDDGGSEPGRDVDWAAEATPPADAAPARSGRRPGTADRSRDAVHGDLHLGHDRRSRRAPSTSTAASRSRPPRTSPTRSTCAPATPCAGSPTSAG